MGNVVTENKEAGDLNVGKGANITDLKWKFETARISARIAISFPWWRGNIKATLRTRHRPERCPSILPGNQISESETTNS
jgi:hypothetical protein